MENQDYCTVTRRSKKNKFLKVVKDAKELFAIQIYPSSPRMHAALQALGYTAEEIIPM